MEITNAMLRWGKGRTARSLLTRAKIHLEKRIYHLHGDPVQRFDLADHQAIGILEALERLDVFVPGKKPYMFLED